MAESELGVRSSQCLDRRIPDKQTLIEEFAAWENGRNKNHANAEWQFITADARIKLKRLYPALWVLMFRVLVLQALYTLSDDQTEYQLRDRLSFMRFAGLALHDAVPDAKTIWLFREHLTRNRALAKLFRTDYCVLLAPDQRRQLQ